MISIIDASHHNPGTAYFAATRYKFGDFSPTIYRTTDYGSSWKKITKGIPEMDFTRVVREDPNKEGLLYAGTETGLYISFDAGENWQPLQLNLPAVPITDLAVHKRDKDLIVATQGRSFWVLDDLPVLHQMTDEIAKADYHLFDPEDPYLFGRGFGGGGSDAGENPASGAVVYFSLAEQQESEIKLEFIDMRGNIIQTYSSTEDSRGRPVRESALFYEEDDDTPPTVVPNEAGLNKFVWNLRYPGVTYLDGRQIMWSGNTDGPSAIPGTYTVRLHIGDEMVAEQNFEVMKDPRLVEVTQDDLIAQFELVQTINAKLDTTHKSINRIRAVTEEISELMKEVDDNEELSIKASELLKAIADIEQQLVQTKAEAGQDLLNFPIRLNNKLAALKGTVATGYGRPTAQQYAVFEDLAAKVDVQLNNLNAIWNGEYESILEEIETPTVPINR
jgi:hypothetical protein